MNWHNFNNKKNIGKRGSENGIIISDIAYGDEARITIEKDGITAPFTITLGVYGVMMHTEFFSTYQQAIEYQQKTMRVIERMIAMFQIKENERDEVWHSDLIKAIEEITNYKTK